MTSMHSVILVFLLTFGVTAVFAQATTRIEEKFWVEYIYAVTEAKRATALQKLQKWTSVEQLVLTLRDFRQVPGAKQETAADLRELAQSLRNVTFNLTDFPEALTLAYLQRTLPPSKEDQDLLLKDLELCRELLTGISILADIRVPGTQINLKGNDSREIQGCALESARLARAVYFLGVAKRDINYLNMGREAWMKSWNTLSDENRKFVLKLPIEANAREFNVDDALKAHLEMLSEKYPNPNAKAATPEIVPGALSPEELENRNKQIAALTDRLKVFYESWNKGDSKSLDAILAKDYKDRDALITNAAENKLAYKIDEHTKVNVGESDKNPSTLWVSKVHVKYSGKEPEEFRSLHVVRFSLIDGLWRIVEFER